MTRVHFTPDVYDGCTIPNRFSAEIPFSGRTLLVSAGGVVFEFVRRRREFTKDGVTLVWYDIEPAEWAAEAGR